MTRQQQQQERIARRIAYATGQQVEVTSATPVKNEIGEVASVKVTTEKLDQQERYCRSAEGQEELSFYEMVDAMIANGK